MIGRRCKAGNGFSRPVLIARNLSFGHCRDERLRIRILTDCVFQAKYCGGFSSVDPPLPIPNREVKRTHADGTAPPGGRVGSRRSSKALMSKDIGAFLFRRTAAESRCLGDTPNPAGFTRPLPRLSLRSGDGPLPDAEGKAAGLNAGTVDEVGFGDGFALQDAGIGRDVVGEPDVTANDGIVTDAYAAEN